MEIWKDIKGYEGSYQVSNFGRIKSFKKRFGTQECTTIMKANETWGGYLRVGLTKDKKSKLFAVHRLVAEAFIPKVEGKPIVDHINGDRKDNRVENLRWCTFSENAKFSKRMKSDRYNSVKVVDSQGNTFNSYREAGRFWGLSPNTIKNDCKNAETNTKRKIRFKMEEFEEWNYLNLC